MGGAAQKDLGRFGLGFRQGGVGVDAEGDVLDDGAHLDRQGRPSDISPSVSRPTMPTPRIRWDSGSMMIFVIPSPAPMVMARPEYFQGNRWTWMARFSRAAASSVRPQYAIWGVGVDDRRNGRGIKGRGARRP